MTPPVALTVAGSDSGGGAGIQADLKTFAAQRCYGASVITAVTAQNTRAVTDVHPVPVATVRSQLAAVLEDLPAAAVKTGMLGSPEIADLVAAWARDGSLPHLVVDPVLISTTGFELGVTAAIERLLPYALVATPNLAEAAALVGRPVATVDEMVGAARDLAAGGARYVVVTGGEPPTDETPDPQEAVDVLWHGDRGAGDRANGEPERGEPAQLLRGPRVSTVHTHGSGCTFSAAIAARLAQGYLVPDAVAHAKSYVAQALAGSAEWRLGGGFGPLDHFAFSSPADREPRRANDDRAPGDQPLQ